MPADPARLLASTTRPASGAVQSRDNRFDGWFEPPHTDLELPREETMSATTASRPTVSRTILTPTGPLRVVVSEIGVRAVHWEDEVPDPTTDEHASPRLRRLLDEAVTQIDDWFAGRRLDFDLPLDEIGTDFQRRAWAVLRSIPYGETISYGEQAGRLGDARKARAIGGANGRNPIAVITPCHRVIGADGSLTGFASGTDRKRWLLDHEAKLTAAR